MPPNPGQGIFHEGPGDSYFLVFSAPVITWAFYEDFKLKETTKLYTQYR